MAQIYNRMVIASDQIPIWYNLAAAVALWIILAGFTLIPGTFASLKESDDLRYSQEGQFIRDLVQNIPLLPLAGACYFAGITGLGMLWRKFKVNYIWLLTHIFV